MELKLLQGGAEGKLLTLEQIKKNAVQEALAITKGNRLQAAKILNINRNTLASIVGENKKQGEK